MKVAGARVGEKVYSKIAVEFGFFFEARVRSGLGKEKWQPVPSFLVKSLVLHFVQILYCLSAKHTGSLLIPLAT
jgi:hypothetical protein